MPVGDIDGLSLLAVAEAEQPFAGLVLARLHERGLRAADDEALGELLLHRFGDSGHTREIGRALMVDPVPNLLGAERRLADGGQLGGEFGAREADEIAPAIGELGRRRGEARGFGEDADPLGLGEVDGIRQCDGAVGHLGGHALTIAAYAAEKPRRLKLSDTCVFFGAGDFATSFDAFCNAATTARPSRAKAERWAV